VTWLKFIEKLKLTDENVAANNEKPDMNIARLAIQKAQAQILKNKGSTFGRVKALFTTSAQVLDNHNYLFDLLPNGDKYTSVFTGTFSSIVKVRGIPLSSSRTELIRRTKGDNYSR
jgi:outer membrane protein TolC